MASKIQTLGEKIMNPFEYGKPITDPARFFGRQSELIRIRDGCYQMRSISIVGERRVGKSSLLRLFTIPEFIKKFNFGDKYIFCFYDFQGIEDITQEQFWIWVLAELIEKVQEKNLQTSIKTVLEAKSFDNISLRRLFEKLRSKNLIFLFDEFETILQNLNLTKPFYGHLRYLTQNCPVVFITATSRELVYHCIDDDTKTSPFFNIFDNLVVKPFEDKECRDLVQTYLQESGISFTESEIVKLIELSGGYAAFFQVACFFLFYAYQDNSIEDNETERWAYVEENFRLQINPHFAYFWNKSEEEEKILLALIAILITKGLQNIPEQEIKDLYPRYKNDLLTLNNRSMVLNDNGNYRLFSPVFAEWIVMELTDISQKGESSIEEWIVQYEKSFLEKGLQKIGNIFKRVNPKYWELLRKILLLVRDPKHIVNLLEKLGHIF